LNAGPVVTLFQRPPDKNTTVKSLIDFGTGISNLANVDAKVALK
jgi:hypothetical protein